MSRLQWTRVLFKLRIRDFVVLHLSRMKEESVEKRWKKKDIDVKRRSGVRRYAEMTKGGCVS